LGSADGDNRARGVMAPWRMAAFGLLGAAAAGLVAWVYVLLTPPQYQAQALLTLAPTPPLEAALSPPAVSALPPGEDDRTVLLKQRVLEALRAPLDAPWAPRERNEFSVPDYVQLFESDFAVAQVRDFMNAQRRRPQSLEAVRRNMQARGRVLTHTRDAVVYQEVISLRLSDADPALAASAANYWANVCQEMVRSLQAKRLEAVLRELEERAARLRARLEEAGESPLLRQQLAQIEAYQAAAGPGAAAVVLAARAMVPESPVGPGRAGLVLVAALLGGLAALAAVAALRALQPFIAPSVLLED